MYYDLEKLKAECPDVKSFYTLNSDEIMSLYDYHPWNDSQNVDYVTFKILNLKKNESKDTESRHHSVRFFAKALKKSIIPLINFKNISCCIVPKSEKNKESTGMVELLKATKKDIGFTNTDNLLERVVTVDKAATGGARSVKIHKDSINVKNIDDIKYKNILLFDDVTTTGSSLVACKQLLMDAQASQVIMIALGATSLRE